MRKYGFILAGMIIVLGLIAGAYAAKSTMKLDAGDDVYVCNCGEKCPCQTMSKNPGNCTCGKELIKAKVSKAEEGMVSVKAEAWPKERNFRTTGKYACACGDSCKCDTISQNPGKCTCGNEMEKVK